MRFAGLECDGLTHTSKLLGFSEALISNRSASHRKRFFLVVVHVHDRSLTWRNNIIAFESRSRFSGNAAHERECFAGAVADRMWVLKGAHDHV
jgi:hypothetical protein